MPKHEIDECPGCGRAPHAAAPNSHDPCAYHLGAAPKPAHLGSVMNVYVVTFRCRLAGAIGLRNTSVYSKRIEAPNREAAIDEARLACFVAGYEHTNLVECTLVRGTEPEAS